MASNVEQYKKYAGKLKLLGYPADRQWIKCEIDEQKDQVVLTSINYAQTDPQMAVLEIPSFVTHVCQSDDTRFEGLVDYNNEAIRIKIIHKNNQIKSLGGLFQFQRSKIIDLSECDLKGVEDMEMMFYSQNVEEVIFGNQTLTSCTNVQSMYKDSMFLRKIDMQGIKFVQLRQMSHICYNCRYLEEIKIGHVNSDIEFMDRSFELCEHLQHLDLGGFEQLDGKVNLGGAFHRCYSLLPTSEVNKLLELYEKQPVKY